MKQKEILTWASFIIIALIAIFVIAGMFIYRYSPTVAQKTNTLPMQNQVQNTPQANNLPAQILPNGTKLYTNSQYNFSFEFPATWNEALSNQGGVAVSFLSSGENQNNILNVLVINKPPEQAKQLLPYPYAPNISIPATSVQYLKINNILWTKFVYPAGYGITDQFFYQNGNLYDFEYLTNYASQVQPVFNSFKFNF